MAIEIRPPLESFCDYVRATDEHASHRLALLARAAQLLSGGQQAPSQKRRALAAKLEKWRYQHLNERSSDFSLEDRALADALDLAANELAGRRTRPPRNPSEAVDDTSGDTAGNTVGNSAPIGRVAACLSPDVAIDELIRQATELTCKHFSVSTADNAAARQKRRMLIYAPLYLSSECVNHCRYCGFSYRQDIERKHLATDEVLHQAEILRARGFHHVLLVAGDFPSRTTTAYFAELIRALKARRFDVALEIAPQSTDSYAELVDAGARGVTLYQETYDRRLYRSYHIRGPKASFHWRLEGLERAAEAGTERLGLGVLLGLADPREDVLALVRHAVYLQQRFGDRAFAFSLPRIKEPPADFRVHHPVDDEQLIRLYCALRVGFPRHELVLSTREPAPLRDRLAGICITQMSAGSSTTPGGYDDDAPCAGEQFPVSDRRTPAEVAARLGDAGIEPVWGMP